MSLIRKKKDKLINTVSEDRKKIFKIGIIILLIIIAACVGVFFLYKHTEKQKQEAESALDEYDKYVGPEDAPDRGEWVDSIEYYGFYGDSGAEGDVAGKLFPQNGENKGIVAAGLVLQPVVVTYEDFSPYNSISENGFMTDYSCTSEPEEIEVQLGKSEHMIITGSYRNEHNDMFYEGLVNINLDNIQYYTEMTYDRNQSVSTEQDPGYYGYINPNFEFDYDITGEAHVTDSYPDYLGDISFSSTGSLKSSEWKFTSSLSGQGDEVFRIGEIYIRCKIPCEVEKSYDGYSENYDGYVNIYFRINETRIGTRTDCIPQHILDKKRSTNEK